MIWRLHSYFHCSSRRLNMCQVGLVPRRTSFSPPVSTPYWGHEELDRRRCWFRNAVDIFVAAHFRDKHYSSDDSRDTKPSVSPSGVMVTDNDENWVEGGGAQRNTGTDSFPATNTCSQIALRVRHAQARDTKSFSKSKSMLVRL